MNTGCQIYEKAGSYYLTFQFVDLMDLVLRVQIEKLHHSDVGASYT